MYHLKLVFILFIILYSIMISMSNPIKKSMIYEDYEPMPKWWNACDWTVFENEFVGKIHTSIDELIYNVMKNSKIAKNHAKHIKNLFTKLELKDPTIELSLIESLDWYPKIPDSTEFTFKKIKFETGIALSYELIQYFAVGIDQILIDQQLNDGLLLKEFKEIKYKLYQLLCDLQYLTHVMNIKPIPKVSKNVMSYQYRDIPEDSRRNLRDIIIIRDYINANDFIATLFAFYRNNLYIE